MKRLIALVVLMLLAACNSQKKYSDFDYSYSRSGGLSPIYENMWIKGNNAHYSFEGQGKSVKKDYKLTAEELKLIDETLTQNNFRMIQEDYRKVYDYIATSIVVKKGSQAASKSDASYIMEKDKARWENVKKVFEGIVAARITAAGK